MPKKRTPKSIPPDLKLLSSRFLIAAPGELVEKINELLNSGTKQGHVAHHTKWSKEVQNYFEETGNPLFAWEGYLHARKAGVPVPEWILEHLDMVAGRLLKWDEKQAKAKDLRKCLGFGSGAGPGPWKTFQSFWIKKNALAFVMVALEKDPSLRSIPDACSKAADQMKLYFGREIEPDTIETWYKQFKHDGG
jgi:hypothetical protein